VCQLKEITRYANRAGVTFLRKFRDGKQEGDNEIIKTDKVFLCKPWLRLGKPLRSSLEVLFLYIGFKGVVGIATVIVPGWDLRIGVIRIEFCWWGMYPGRRPFFNQPEP